MKQDSVTRGLTHALSRWDILCKKFPANDFALRQRMKVRKLLEAYESGSLPPQDCCILSAWYADTEDGRAACEALRGFMKRTGIGSDIRQVAESLVEAVES